MQYNRNLPAALAAPLLAALMLGCAGGMQLAQVEVPADDKTIGVIAAPEADDAIPEGRMRLLLSLAERILVPEDGRLTIAVADADGITIARKTQRTGQQPYEIDVPVSAATSWPLTITGYFGSRSSSGGALSASVRLGETADRGPISLSLVINRNE